MSARDIFEPLAGGETSADLRTRVDRAQRLFSLGVREKAREGFALALAAPPAALDALRGLGRIAMIEEDDAFAESCWHVAARLAPADPWAGHNRATCLMRMGRLEEAERLYAEQSRAFPDFMPSWRGRAQVADRQGRHDLALAHLETALELAPQHFDTHLDAARQCLALALPVEARRRLAAAAALSPGDPRLAELERALPAGPDDALRRAEDALRAGRLEEAFADLNAACEAAPDDPRANYALAQCLVALGRPREAIAPWLRAAEAKPGDPWIRNELGHFAVERGELALAEAQFAAILEADPRFFHALRGLARVAKARGRRELALSLYERAAEADPADPWMPCEIAHLEASLGRDGAAERLRRLVALRPDFAPAYQALARLVGDAAEAVRLLDAASALRPQDAWLAFEAARARRASGDAAGAQARLADLARAGAASAAARQELYHLLRERGEETEAAALLRESLLAAPDDPGLLVAEAARLTAEGRLDEADALYDDLARRDLAPYWRRIGKGALARRRGLATQARRWFEEAIGIEPTEPAAYGELCALVVTQDEAEDLARRLDAWIEAAPRSYAARAQKARLTGLRADPAAALAEWRGIAENWPEKPEVFVEMAREQERLGDAAAALRLLEHAAALDPDHPALLEARARQAEWRDDLEGAESLTARAIEVAPGRFWLRPQLARLQFLAGRSEAAFATIDAFAARSPDPDLEVQRIEILRQTGRLGEAADASRAARARFDGHFRLLWQGTCLEVDLGRFDAAAAAIGSARPADRFEASGLAFLAGYAAMGLWDFETARAHLETALRANPQDGWALNRLIHCQLMLFDIEAAQAGLRALSKLDRSFNQIKGRSTAYSQTHYGQLFDEFRLDAEALAETSAALKIGEEPEKLAALRACVRRYPHYTPACIAALTACRRAGLLNPRPPHGGGPAIPPRLAQFWDAADPPADLDPYLRSWRERDGGLDYRRFDLPSAESELSGPDCVGALQAFRRAEQPAMRADIFRLAWLRRNGGAYADADDRCQRSLAPLRTCGASLVVYQEDLGSIGNNFLMASTDHPVIARALEDAASAVDEGAADLLWLSTGPGALTRALAAHLFANETQWRARIDEVRILDRPEMLSHVAIHCHSAYKTTERHWSRTAFRRRPAVSQA